MFGYWPSSFLCDYASDKSSCAQPLGNICLPCQSRGWGIIKFCLARGSGICPPLAFDTYYVDFDSNITKRGGFYWKLDINKEIGRLADWLIYKGAKNVWRCLEVWFLDLCMHFFIAYHDRTYIMKSGAIYNKINNNDKIKNHDWFCRGLRLRIALLQRSTLNEKFHFKHALSCTIRLGDQWKLVQCGLRTGLLAAQVYQL